MGVGVLGEPCAFERAACELILVFEVIVVGSITIDMNLDEKNVELYT